MIRVWLVMAAIGGFASVAAGAMGAHFVADARAAELLRTGAVYGMVHAVALLALVAMAPAGEPRIAGTIAGWSFGVGIVLFSFSLFALALTGMRWLGAITPFGGVAFMVGWAAVAVLALQRL